MRGLPQDVFFLPIQDLPFRLEKKKTCLDLVEKNNVWAMLDIHE